LAPQPGLDDDTPDRSPYKLSIARNGSLAVNAGSLQGLSAGTVFAVFPQAGKATSETPLGYVQIAATGTGVLTSQVEPVEYPSGTPPVSADVLPDDGECKIVVHSIPAFRTLVGVEAEPSQGGSPPVVASELQRIKDVLLQLMHGDQGLPIKVSDDPKNAEWTVRIGPTASFLVPSSSIGTDGRLIKDPVRYGPIPRGDRSSRWLADWFARFGRAQSLVRVVEGLTDSSAGKDLEVEIRRYLKKPDGVTDLTDAQGKPRTEVLDSNRTIEVYDGDDLAFVVSNNGSVALDFSILMLDGDSGIQAFFPSRDRVENNTLEPGKRVSIPVSDRLTYEADHKEVDQIVLLAVTSRDGQPVDFSAFDQPSFEQARGGAPPKGAERTTRDQNMLSTELGKLLDQSVNMGQRNGVRRRRITGVVGRVVTTWTGLPKARPTKP
jgi:hypothetical protein